MAIYLILTETHSTKTFKLLESLQEKSMIHPHFQSSSSKNYAYFCQVLQRSTQQPWSNHQHCHPFSLQWKAVSQATPMRIHIQTSVTGFISNQCCLVLSLHLGADSFTASPPISSEDKQLQFCQLASLVIFSSCYN